MKSEYEEALKFFQNGQLDKAKDICFQILKLEPNNFNTLYLLGLIAFHTKNYQKSAQIFEKAIKIKPNDPVVYNSQAIALIHDKNFKAAVKGWDKAIEIKPDYVEAYYNRGNALLELKQTTKAIESWDKAIEINPKHAEAFNNCGNALLDLNKIDESIIYFNKAIEINPNYAEAYYNLGNAFKNFKKLNEAVTSYTKAIQLKFENIEVYNNLGNVFLELRQPKKALINYDKAIKIKSDSSEAHYNRGNALVELKEIKKAIESFDKAIEIKSDYAEAFKNRGYALLNLNKTEDSLYSINRAFQLNPELDYLFGQLFFLKNSISDWKLFDSDLKKIEEGILNKKKISIPFSILSFIDSSEIQKSSAEIFLQSRYRSRYPSKKKFKEITFKKSDKKIRIGYYSADFCNHAVAYLIAELFELHDKSKFELIGFYFGKYKNDEMRKRISSAFDKFIDIDSKNEKEIANLSRELGIDIAVDLMGFTKDNKFGIFLERCAPIQLSYLGYSATTGSDCIDYIIGDKVVIPKETQKDFSEKIIYLPNSFMVNDSTKKISDKIFTREELSLPKNSFVFCCFNKFYKISPKTFDVWMKLLNKVENSVLWLINDNSIGVKNLKEEANKRGIDSKRIIFANYANLLSEHLAKHRQADLFIDTMPYNGHTRVSDALWAGLPVITKIGKSFPSRVSASLLNALDLQELITHTEKEYEDLAIDLATNKNKLREIKNKLEKNKLTSTLFNSKVFTQNIESAYTEIYKRYLNNFPISNVEIK